MRVDHESEVLAANASFYDAFDRRDVAAMERLWARRVPVACIHPGWAPLFGRDEVLSSWHAILNGPGAPRISCTNAVVHGLGEGSALVVCVEVLPGGAMVATNVFVREDGDWRMVQHHAGPVAGLPVADAGGGRTVH